MKRAAIVIIVSIFLSGCSREANVSKSSEFEKYHRFTGELLSVIDQQSNKEAKRFNGDYTVTVTRTVPSTEQFTDYDRSNLTQEDYFFITDRTHVYRVLDDQSKELITPAELEINRGRLVEFWVKPIKDRRWDLEAIEVTIVK